MQIQTFDQIEFGDYGSSEFWVATAIESKVLSGSRKDLISFFEVTDLYECFSRWQTKKIDSACQMSIEKATDGIAFELDYLIPWVNENTSLKLKKEQIVHLVYSEWCLLDIVWEDNKFNYRLMWCTTV